MNYLKTSLLTALIIVCSLTVSGQETSDIILIRVYETTGSGSKIVVCQGEKTLKVVDSLKSINARTVEGNTHAISAVVTDYLQQDYKILSSVSGSTGSAVITSYVLVKE